MLYHFGVSYSLPKFGSCFLSLSVFSQSLCKSALMTTFPLRSRIFWIKSHFFNEFNADSDKFKIFVLLSPILNNLLKCRRREMKILKFNRSFCQFTSLPYGCSAQKWLIVKQEKLSTLISFIFIIKKWDFIKKTL